jgi:hypothetical protein
VTAKTKRTHRNGGFSKRPPLEKWPVARFGFDSQVFLGKYRASDWETKSTAFLVFYSGPYPFIELVREMVVYAMHPSVRCLSGRQLCEALQGRIGPPASTQFIRPSRSNTLVNS